MEPGPPDPAGEEEPTVTGHHLDPQPDRRAPLEPVRRPVAERGAGHPVLDLQRTAGNAATAVLMRKPVAVTPVKRLTKAQLLDPPGTSLTDFVTSVSAQADWFAEPSLTAADRDALQKLLVREKRGGHIQSGVGDLLLADLIAVSDADWVPLEEFCHGRENIGGTVRLLDDSIKRTLAERIALGRIMIDLKKVFDADTLSNCISETQLLDLQKLGLLPKLQEYRDKFHPNLEMIYQPTVGARDEEFQKMLDLLAGAGIAPFLPLLGRIRDLHRFSVTVLTTLVANFADTSRKRPVHLILHGSRDAAGAFQDSAGLFESLILDNRNLHLLIEGADSIADLTLLVPKIAQDYGKPDATGTFRIGQVMIAGHGESQTVDLAQNDGMDVNPKHAADAKKTKDLLDALMANMDPATARVVYAGCLVGSHPVGPGVPNGKIPGKLAASKNLVEITEESAKAHGIAAGRTQGARASVALGMSSSLMDASGNMGITYDFDPAAYADALTYVATGHEPEGLFRAAVEIAANPAQGPKVAFHQLDLRKAMGITADHQWFDDVVMAGVTVALKQGSPAAGVPAGTLNAIEHMVGPPFLVGNSEDGHGRNALDVDGSVNHSAFRGAFWPALLGQPNVDAPKGDAMNNGRMALEQAAIKGGQGRAASFLGWLAAADEKTSWIADRLFPELLGGSVAALLAGPATTTKIRLALAWFRKDEHDPTVRAFLKKMVLRPPTGPELPAAVTDELDGESPHTVLVKLKVVAEVKVGTGPTLPAGNAQIRKGRGNEVRIEPHAFEATVVPKALNVRASPGMSGRVLEIVHKGDVLQAAGDSGGWVAVDRNGTLGFVLRTLVTGG
jgi:hypothetical protein